MAEISKCGGIKDDSPKYPKPKKKPKEKKKGSA